MEKVRIFPDKPVTVRPTERRIGSGKGSPDYWVAVVKPGRILYEMSGVAENIARKARLKKKKTLLHSTYHVERSF